MLHHCSVGRVQNNHCNSLLKYNFWHFFAVLHQETVLSSFFDEVSDFRNRILTIGDKNLSVKLYACQDMNESAF